MSNLWATILLCPKVVCFRIKRTGWLRVKDQYYYVVGGEKAMVIPYLSIVKKGKKKGSWEGKGSLQLILSAFTQSWESFLLTCTHSRVKYSMQHYNSAGRLKAKADGRGWSWKLGEERGWTVISQGQSLHNKQAGSRCYNSGEYWGSSKWQLSCRKHALKKLASSQPNAGRVIWGERRKNRGKEK